MYGRPKDMYKDFESYFVSAMMLGNFAPMNAEHGRKVVTIRSCF